MLGAPVNISVKNDQIMATPTFPCQVVLRQELPPMHARFSVKKAALENLLFPSTLMFGNGAVE